MHTESCLWRLSALVVLFTADSVLGQTQNGRYDILTGINDETSCDMRDAMFARCSSSPTPLDATPTTTLCTCNNVFFNIWSACSYSSGNNTLPIYSSWLATCANNSVDLSESAGIVSNGYPRWASLPVPGNTTFDIQRAVDVVASSEGHQWSPLQIVLPVVSGLVATIVTFVFMTVYRRKPADVHWREEMGRIIRHPPRVKNIDQQTDDWEIEPAEPPPSIVQDPENRYEPVRPPSPPETIPGHPSRTSESLTGGSLVQETMSEELYPFSSQALQGLQARPIAPVRTPPALQSSSSSGTSRNKWPLSKSSRVTLSSMFRRGPSRVIPKAPYKGWGIDQSTDASSSKRTTFATTSEGGTNTRASVDPTDGPRETSEEYHYIDSQDDHTNLITDEERTNSLLFSEEFGQRTALSSSVNSHINVVSPSNSTSSPTSANPSRGSRVSLPVRPPIPLPPPPDRPAPPPPQLPPRVTPRGRENSSGAITSPQNYFLQERAMSPIQEDLSDISVDLGQNIPLGHVDSSASQSSGQFPVRKYSSERRPLPSPTKTGPSPLGHRPPVHQLSQSLPSLEPIKSNDSSSLRSTHSRSSSADRPRPLPPTNGPLPMNRQLPAFNHSHQRSGSNNSSASSGYAPSRDYFDDVFLPSVPHGRGLLADDTDSFYWTSEPAVSSGRSGTPNSSSDPSAFFPGSVRGAGYGGFH